ncbi:hypothetical protein [Pontibacter sp. G13]|uniref:hypothetical protein n=1 Tax=Pontibacter sp. G13 TaxID=3074898 RepID=UPI00288BF248|nr:hypothetical protein [Pontibacter sp. G13]WNJ18999.1 hypothetical protein RJD25_00790 [Pontibacter sp. G13]
MSSHTNFYLFNRLIYIAILLFAFSSLTAQSHIQKIEYESFGYREGTAFFSLELPTHSDCMYLSVYGSFDGHRWEMIDYVPCCQSKKMTFRRNLTPANRHYFKVAWVDLAGKHRFQTQTLLFVRSKELDIELGNTADKRKESRQAP